MGRLSLFCSFVPILHSAILEEHVVSRRISNGGLGVLHAGNWRPDASVVRGALVLHRWIRRLVREDAIH